MNPELQQLIPRHKFDIEALAQLKKCSLQDIKPIIPQLLAWLQDMNWPIAQPLAAILIPHTPQLGAEILAVLHTDDEEWKYWIVSVFGPVTNSPEVLQEIWRMAHNPTDAETREGLDQLTRDILEARKA